MGVFIEETQKKVAEFRDLLPQEEDDVSIDEEVETESFASRATSGVAYLKFEPMVLHVQCADLEAARRLHLAAIDSGFKNSGLSVGKKKIIAAIRSSHSLEVPISDEKGNLIVSEQYLRFVVKLADDKLALNFQSIERLRGNVEKALSSSEGGESGEEKTFAEV